MFGWLKLKSNADVNDTLPIGVTNQRKATRHKRTTQIDDHLVALVGASAWPAKVRDISSDGVGLVVGMLHKSGTRLQMILRNRRSNYYQSVEAVVMRVVLLPDGRWLLGCRFRYRLDREELEALL
jgi:hypothetical protein